MTKGEVLETLKRMFIGRFGVEEVNLKNQIQIDYSWDVGSTYITKVRFTGKKFEYYKECWSYGWEGKQNIFNKYGIRILSDCLDVKVKTRTEYFIDQKVEQQVLLKKCNKQYDKV